MVSDSSFFLETSPETVGVVVRVRGRQVQINVDEPLCYQAGISERDKVNIKCECHGEFATIRISKTEVAGNTVRDVRSSYQVNATMNSSVGATLSGVAVERIKICDCVISEGEISFQIRRRSLR